MDYQSTLMEAIVKDMSETAIKNVLISTEMLNKDYGRTINFWDGHRNMTRSNLKVNLGI
jgi:hypothetical protein